MSNNVLVILGFFLVVFGSIFSGVFLLQRQGQPPPKIMVNLLAVISLTSFGAYLGYTIGFELGSSMGQGIGSDVFGGLKGAFIGVGIGTAISVMFVRHNRRPKMSISDRLSIARLQEELNGDHRETAKG